MSAIIWTERSIAGLLARQFFRKKYLLLVPNCTWPGNECDLLVVTENLRVIDVEVKISRADLKADAKKDKWWRRSASWAWNEPRPSPVAREWPTRVWKHYYAMPEAIWKPELAEALPSKASGVLLLRQINDIKPRIGVKVWRRATPDRQAQPVSATAAIDIARLANIRMWEAFSTIDAPQDGFVEEIAA